MTVTKTETDTVPVNLLQDLSSSIVEIDPDVDYCVGQPCGIHGECYNATNQYICKCSSGYNGDNCSIGKNSLVEVTYISGTFTIIILQPWVFEIKLIKFIRLNSLEISPQVDHRTRFAKNNVPAFLFV